MTRGHVCNIYTRPSHDSDLWSWRDESRKYCKRSAPVTRSTFTILANNNDNMSTNERPVSRSGDHSGPIRGHELAWGRGLSCLAVIPTDKYPPRQHGSHNLAHLIPLLTLWRWPYYLTLPASASLTGDWWRRDFTAEAFSGTFWPLTLHHERNQFVSSLKIPN